MEIAQTYIFQKKKPTKTVLRILGVARSTFYYQKKGDQRSREGRPIPGYSETIQGKKISDEQIEEWICDILSGEENAYGYRKVTKVLRKRYELQINKKKVYRLCKKLKVLRPQRQKKGLSARIIARNRVIIAPCQLWELDIKYGYIEGEERFFFLMCMIEV